MENDSNTIENNNTSINGSDKKGNNAGKYHEYAYLTHKSAQEMVFKIVQKNGSGLVQRSEIGLFLGLADATLTTRISSCVYYGLFDKDFNKGYIPTKLFDKIQYPKDDKEKAASILESLKKPELFDKIIEEYNGKVLPAEEPLSHHLKREYGINPNSAQRAAKVFLENMQDYGLIDPATNKLVFHTYKITGDTVTTNSTPVNEVKPEETKVQEKNTDPDLFEFPIPLTEGKIAKLRYPRDTMTSKDIEIIKMAVSLIELNVK